MPRLAPVFDTNVYRKGFDVDELRRLESGCDVQPLANFYTFIELGAHLGAPDDSAFSYAASSLSRMHAHTVRSEAGRQFIPFIADVEGDLARSLFGQRLPGRDQEAETYGNTLGVVALKHSSDWDSRTLQVLAALRERRDRVEAQFTADMIQAVKAIDPTASGWQPFPRDAVERKRWGQLLRRLDGFPFTAEALVRRAAAQLGIAPTDADIHPRRDWVIATYPAALHFYNGLVRKSVESGIDFSASKHVNNIWDLQLMFLAADDSTTDEVPIVLVSDEAGMAAAAKAAGVPERVWSYSEYFQRLTAFSNGASARLGSPAL
jgi:hypothetical protein